MKLRLGTRGSALALRQAELLKDALETAHADLVVELCPVVTSGDRKQGSPEAVRDKKEWILEIEQALVRGEIDVAVHSGKDVPVDIESGTAITSVLNRASAADVFISRSSLLGLSARPLASLQSGEVVGTSSLRRQAQLLMHVPGINVQVLRGNIPTRLERVRQNEQLAGLVIAAASVERLTVEAGLPEVLAPATFVPAMNQGILVAQRRMSDSSTAGLLQPLVNEETQVVWRAERTCIRCLGADCRSAVGVLAELTSGEITLTLEVYAHPGMPLGSAVPSISVKVTGRLATAEALGEAAAAKALAMGAEQFLHHF